MPDSFSSLFFCLLKKKKYLPIGILCFILLFINLIPIRAIQSPEDTVPHVQNNNIQEQKDVVDILIKTVKMNRFIRNDTVRLKSRGPYYSFLPSVSYEMVSSFTASVETNIAFYTDKQRSRISSVLVNADYSILNQQWSIINSNIFIDDSRINFLGDWRIYHFPTHTYGLGGKTLPSNSTMIDYMYLRFYEVALYELTQNIYAGLGYMLDYHWDVKEINVPKDVITDFQKYGTRPQSVSSGVSVNLQYDSRANCVNPQQGAYANIQYRNNPVIFGSDNNWQSLLLDVRKYIQLPTTSKNVLCFWSYNSFTLNGNPPYLDLASIGWDAYSNTGRGYIQGRYRSKSMIFFESEYRFGITRNGLIGGVTFANIGSYSDWPSNKFTTVIPAGGLGIRIKLNKHSNVNFATDFAIGTNGSKGFFFNMGEVF
jgi:hypothetical protein